MLGRVGCGLEGQPWMAGTTSSASSSRLKNSLLGCPGPPIKCSPSHNSRPRHWDYLSDSPPHGATWIRSRTWRRSSKSAERTIRSPNKTGPLSMPNGRHFAAARNQTQDSVSYTIGHTDHGRDQLWQSEWHSSQAGPKALDGDRARPGGTTVVGRHLLPYERSGGRSHSRRDHRSWRSCALDSL